MKKKKISIITLLLIIFGIFISSVNSNHITYVETGKVNYLEENEESNYEIQQSKLGAISVNIKGDYDSLVKSVPASCKCNIDRITKIIYNDEEKVLGEKEIKYKKPAGKLMQPTKRGYTFVQWINKYGELIDEKSIINSTVNYDIYATWNIIVSELTVMPNGGTWNGSTGEQQFNLAYNTEKDIEDPTRTGYTFAGWEVTGDGSSIENKKYKMGVENSTIKAKWTPNVYNLTIDPNSGTYKGSSSSTKTKATYDSETKIETPIRTGYTFVGWTLDHGRLKDNNTFILDYPGDATLIANWKINNYKYIVYHKKENANDNGEIVVPGDTLAGQAEYKSVLKPSVNSYTGFKKPAQQTLIIDVDTDPPTKNVINYKYLREKHTLTINTNGGSISGVTSKSMKYEETLNINPPTKTGHTFTGWTKSSNDSSMSGNIFKMGLTNTTLTANWKARQYVLTYNVNGGNAISGSTRQNVTYGQAYGSLKSTSRAGYDFKGWYTDSGERITASTIHRWASNLTVHARWSNNAPNQPAMTIRYMNSGLSDHGELSGGRETAYVDVVSYDAQDGWPSVYLTCTSGALCNNINISKISESNYVTTYKVTMYKAGVGLLKAVSTDRTGLYSTSNNVLQVYGSGADTGLQYGHYTNTTFETDWFELIDGCYIYDYIFTVQFDSRHSNGYRTDEMVVEGRTVNGDIVTLFYYQGNMEDYLHSAYGDGINKYGKIVQIRFRTYSPHDDCARYATITYRVKYKFDISLLSG